MRAAIYARYSSDLQSETSIDDTRPTRTPATLTSSPTRSPLTSSKRIRIMRSAAATCATAPACNQYWRMPDPVASTR